MAKNQDLPLVIKISNFRKEMAGIEILKSKEAYGYYYADLDAILKIIEPKLEEHGIGYYHATTCSLERDRNLVRTTLYNLEDTKDVLESATIIDPTTKLAKMNNFMRDGSAMTYFRRYHLVTMLGLTTDEDSDAGGKRPTKQKPGRSVEASSKEEVKTDYIAIFENLIKNKTRVAVEKTLEAYKKQINNADLNKIETLIKDKYEDKPL